jgi:TrmH family RNA methyltransferase
MEQITSQHNVRFKNAMRLHTSRGRQKQQRIIVFGRREIERALEAGIQFEECLMDGSAELAEFQTIRNRLASQRCLFFTLDEKLFTRLAYGNRGDGVIGIAPRPVTELGRLDIPSDTFVVVLESLEKPGNLGAIARSADGAGAGAVMLAEPKTDIFHPNAIRASVSTVFSLPIATATSHEVNQWLLENDFQVFLMTPEATESLFDCELPRKTAFVFGNEAVGLSTIWRQSAHQPIRLPMLGIGDSLNVSVTASLAMYEARRQLSPPQR